MYKDIQAKIAFHKERIIKEFIKRGIYPDDKMIERNLADIDAALALLNHKDIKEGSTFDHEQYNKELELIYKDLELLYKLLFEITKKEYTALKAFVDTHLDELEDTARMYKIKAEQEAKSTTLGQTIYFNHSAFNIETVDNIESISLGTVSVNKGSRISCLFNANDIEPEKIVFEFKRAEEVLRIAPYNYNQDSLVIPGDLDRQSFNVDINPDHVVNGPVELPISEGISTENYYAVLGGKGSLLVKEYQKETSEILLEKPTQADMLIFDHRSRIDFYVVGGKKITFKFNKRPISANFSLSDYSVSNLDYIHHFYIEADEGFAFNFELEQGDVYAVKENGVIDNGKLYFTRAVDIKDFRVERYKTGEKVNYEAFVKIVNDDGNPVDIQSIAIKELLAIGGEV